MKLKNKYVLRNVADKTVAIAVENSDEKTEGVITLNSTGAFIFGLVNEGMEEKEIIDKFFEEYDVTKEEAEKAVSAFVESLVKSGLMA
jgi:reverse gyrase